MSSPAVVIRGLWQSSHPGPTCVVTALALALGVAAGLELWRMLLLAAAVFAGQLSIGISNDAIDAARDRAVGRTDKPLARGDVRIRTAWIAAVGCAIVALVLSAPLGVGMLVAHAVAVISGWAYNAPLKATAFSVVPFLVTFGLFPSLATLSAAEPRFAAPWAFVAGAALGAAVHLSNVLPDLDDDRATGIRGLPHRIGGPASAVAAAAGVIAGALAVLLGPVGGRVGDVSGLSWVFFVAVSVVAVLSAVVGGRGAPRPRAETHGGGGARQLPAPQVATGGALAA
ncbi:UbiA family prenyltransferase [Microbacterium sp. cx-59]|uniref:UbiA family prenyltransferase n=1 Tax=Microbacterium sp. cx-59 TaxID=2891207 RepID=UPI001E3AA868|nr:UbiA family prenyltransferase [Microbacterium sp. cx-59]MCC4909515.1 UbiA family prenyltransferase [Microbacterium sp. cx-59]